MKKTLALVLCLIMAISVAANALADTVEISYWTPFTGGDGDTMQEMVDRFNAENPDIHVTHSPMVQEDLYEKLPLAVQTGNEVPDVCIVHISHVPEMVDSGVLTDVTCLTENGVDLANYPQWMVDAVTLDDLVYAVPFDLHGAICYANLDLLDKYGMTSIVDDRAITFEEVAQLGEAIKAAGDTDVYATSLYKAQWLYLHLYQEKSGKSWLNAEGQLDIDNEIFTQVVEDLRGLVEKGYVIPKDQSDKSLFLGDKLCLFLGGTWTKNTVQSAGKNFIEVIPVGYGAKTSLFTTSSHQFAQPVNDERTEETDLAVAKFVNWMGEHSDIWAEKAGQMAVHTKVINSEAAANLPQAFIVSEEYGHRAMLFNYYHIGLLETALNRIGLTPLYDSTVDASSVGLDLVKEINDAIAQK